MNMQPKQTRQEFILNYALRSGWDTAGVRSHGYVGGEDGAVFFAVPT